MPISVRIGGAWKDGTMSVNVGGAWKSVSQFGPRISGAWKDAIYSAPVINTAAALTMSRTGSGGTVYGGLRLNNDGTTDESNSDGSASFSSPVSTDNWLTSGNPSDVWVEYSNLGSSLDWIDDCGGSGVRFNLGTDCRLGVARAAAFGADVAALTLSFYDAASGGTLLGQIDESGAHVQINVSRTT